MRIGEKKSPHSGEIIQRKFGRGPAATRWLSEAQKITLEHD